MDFMPLIKFMHHLTDSFVPGNAICVYYKNQEVFRYSTGYADVASKQPMSDEILLNIYSCSKPATVTAALQLIEQGKCNLNDPLYEYIPAFSNMQVQEQGAYRPAKEPIKLLHLFTMQAGLDYNTEHPAITALREATNGQMPTVAVAEAIAQRPLLFDPGTGWNYSLCHDVLAAVVEIVSGQRFQEYMVDHIFDPLDMHSVYYHQTPDIQNRMATQYCRIGGPDDLVNAQISGTLVENAKTEQIGKKNHLVFGPSYDSGGAGIIVSVREYARLANALSRHGVGANGNRILQADTIALLRENQLSSHALTSFDWPQLSGYGYGLGVKTRISNADSHRDFGWGGAAGATIFVDPDMELGVFYAHHMLNPQESYYQPLLREAIYQCF